ncbi:MAG: Tol-Pal system beta propeller repeat protein TolB [Pseudomonadota bacterium]
MRHLSEKNQKNITLSVAFWRQWLVFAGVFLALAAPVRAELVIEITRGAVKPIPIAIVPFGWSGTGNAPGDAASVIRSDLYGSGRFDPLDNDVMLERPVRGVDIDFDNWRFVAVDYVLVGRLEEVGDELALTYQLFDVYGARQVVADSLVLEPRDLRLASHRVADAVFEAITGVKGVFSTRVAYISVSGRPPERTYRLIVADADGNNEFVLLESAQPIMSPAWSPDGRQLAYVSFESGRAAVYVQTLRTGSRRAVSDRPGVNNAPAWSPDGRQLALTLSDAEGNLDVHVLTLLGNRLVRLTERRSIDTEPTWSADGRHVYFTSDRGGAPQVYRIAANGSEDAPERVTFEGNYNARPRVSPDGRYLAVVHDDRGRFRVAVQDLETGALQVLSDGSLDESPAFAPNSAQLIYATRREGRGVLETVSTDGLISGRVKSVGNDVREPVWSPYAR